jgi:hypothetical protein
MNEGVKMEPELVTDPRLADVLDELKRREPIFHRLELGTTRADFESQTAPDFWETGASGRRYSREFIWAVLEERYAEAKDDVWETSEFQCREAAAGTYLLTYTLRQDDRLTVWQQSREGWKILYHQGTVVTDDVAVDE